MTKNIQEEIEDKVIDCINSGVSGRLIIFKPEKKGLEDYLAVQRRGEYKEKEMYFQINDLVLPARDINFVKDFQEDTLKIDKNYYLLFAYFDEVKQGIDDYIWLIPSLQFRDVADVIKSEDGKNLLRFESSLDSRNKNKYSKFLVNIKDLGKLILDAFEKGGKFDFTKEPGFNLSEDKKSVNLETLEEFLYNARRDIYASDATSSDTPRLLASKQMEFQKGDYFYRDIYFVGDKKIIGQEIIYLNSRPIWGMNYMGDQIGKLDNDFLKESLFKFAKKCRLGQNCEYEKRDYKYQDQGTGNLEAFSGIEKVYLGGKNIYKLDYQGGLIV